MTRGTVYVRKDEHGKYNAHNPDGSAAAIGQGWKSATRLTVFMQQHGYQVARAPRRRAK